MHSDSKNKKTKKSKVIKCTQCFKSVSVPSRMSIYNYLNNEVEKATVSEIVDFIGLTQPTVSYHLKEMSHSGLLDSEKKGKEVYYFVNHDCPHNSDHKCILHELKFPGLEDFNK